MMSKMKFTAVVLCLFVLATSVFAAPPPTITWGDSVATSVGALSVNNDSTLGTGAWKNDQTKSYAEFYVYSGETNSDLGTFTVADIASITYNTKRLVVPTSNTQLDWFVKIYTQKVGAPNEGSWYGYRLNAEPAFSDEWADTRDTWKEWDTVDAADNTLQFIDTVNVSGWNSANAKPLSEIQAGPVTWYTGLTLDYSTRPVLAIALATGSGWNSVFSGLLDGITITLQNGKSCTFDLEATSAANNGVPSTVYVDDNYTPLACDGHIFGYDAFTTIQDAVAAVANYGTVNIAAGTYSNETKFYDKSITLLGPNAGINPNTATRNDEAIITGGIRAHDSNPLVDYIVVNGLKFIDNPLFIGSLNIRYEITNCIVDGIITSNGSGMQLNSATPVGVVTNNLVQNTSYAGILVDGFTVGVGNLTVTGNVIKNTPKQGLQLANNIGTANISGNAFTNTNTSHDLDRGAIRLYGTNFSGPITISGNTINSSYNCIAVRNLENITGKTINITGNTFNADNSQFIYHGGIGTLTVLASSNIYGNATSNDEIEAMVYHKLDNPALGLVNWGDTRRATAITAADTTSMGGSALVSARLTIANVPISGATVTFACGANTATAVTDLNGTATATLATGNATSYSVAFAGTPNYTAASDSAAITVLSGKTLTWNQATKNLMLDSTPVNASGWFTMSSGASIYVQVTKGLARITGVITQFDADGTGPSAPVAVIANSVYYNWQLKSGQVFRLYQSSMVGTENHTASYYAASNQTLVDNLWYNGAYKLGILANDATGAPTAIVMPY